MPGDFSGLFGSMQTYNPVLDRLKDDLRKGALPNAEIEHPTRKTNELLEEQTAKVVELQATVEKINQLNQIQALQLEASSKQIRGLNNHLEQIKAERENDRTQGALDLRASNRRTWVVAIFGGIISIGCVFLGWFLAQL